MSVCGNDVGVVGGAALQVSVACFLLVPLFDALDPAVVGPKLLRAVCTRNNMHAYRLCLCRLVRNVAKLALLGSLLKGYVIVWRKVDPAGFGKLFHDYKVEVSVQSAHTAATNSTNATQGTHQEQRTVLSTLDIMSSCDGIILILCLQA